MRGTGAIHSLARLSPERFLAERDTVIARITDSLSDKWDPVPSENAIWGLVRIVIAQQISTKAAQTIVERVRVKFPEIAVGGPLRSPFQAEGLRSCGLSPRKAICCERIVNCSERILACRALGQTWEEALRGISGIGPWTLSMFRIMILREPDILPIGDLALLRAIREHYGHGVDLEELSHNWSPFRSVACWYLWRSLGNPPLD
jgi:DNA-3-methyladenine glycosylase II